MITIDAPAKINLALHVLARRTDGFHSLETTLCAVSLYDTITIAHAPPRSGVRLRIEGEPPTLDPADNLVVRAARRFADSAGVAPDFEIHLEKRIPSAAGLGGGSSDAAATLRALDALIPGAADRAWLLELAAELGSDVPFFLCGSTHALAWGRGERLLALPPPPGRDVLIAHPGIPLSTADAFRELARERGDGFHTPARALDLSALVDWDAIGEQASNEFEPFALRRIPKLQPALRALRDAGARIAMLAGSGASVFGIFDHDGGSIGAAAHRIEELGFRTWRASTLESMPKPRRGAPDARLPRVDPVRGRD